MHSGGYDTTISYTHREQKILRIEYHTILSRIKYLKMLNMITGNRKIKYKYAKISVSYFRLLVRESFDNQFQFK